MNGRVRKYRRGGRATPDGELPQEAFLTVLKVD
jgi:hypothetical protein